MELFSILSQHALGWKAESAPVSQWCPFMEVLLGGGSSSPLHATWGLASLETRGTDGCGVYFHYQLDWIWNHLGEATSGRVCNRVSRDV